MQTKNKMKIRNLTVTAVMAAVATVLMFLSFNVPLMPGFIKMDFSELPALLTSFSLGPVYGVAVCLVKNLVNVLFTTTGGVGELSNFLLGALFVFPAGLIYQKKKTRGGALVGSLVGALTMALVSVVTNYFIVYPIYTALMPMDVILGAYQAINPSVQTLMQALVMFNLPFTFLKGMASVIISFLVYKKLSPILKGQEQPAAGTVPAQ